MGFAPEALASGLQYQAQDSDIFVVSYPKCGTTWLQYIVYLLVRQRPLGPDDLLTDHFPHLEESGSSAIEAIEPPRLIKTHLQFEMTPASSQARYLVIARNPFDCAVSFFHHTRGFPRHYDFNDGSFADYFECFIAGAVDFGDYFDHLASWYQVQGRHNVLFITFESLKRRTAEIIRRIAAFLGERAESAIATEKQLAALIGEASLASMQRNQQRWSSPRPAEAPEFVRKGEVGGWRSQFTASQADRLLAKFDSRLSRFGLENFWQEEIAEVRAFAGNSSIID